jgi:hypothetical protein
MWRRTWSSPSTTRTNCTSAEQRTQTARRTRASSSEDPRRRPIRRPGIPPGHHPARGGHARTGGRLTARLNRLGVFGGGVRAAATGAGRSRERGLQEARLGRDQHRGIVCVSCLNGSQMLRGRSWVRSQGSAEPAGMRSSTRHGGAPPTSAARAPHGTSPFPVTRISQSRSAEAMSGARRSPSAARVIRGHLDAGCGCARRRSDRPGLPIRGGDRCGAGRLRGSPRGL